MVEGMILHYVLKEQKRKKKGEHSDNELLLEQQQLNDIEVNNAEENLDIPQQ